MFVYCQSSGKMCDVAGDLVAIGYSGLGAGKNNPKMEKVPGVGPIPQGAYSIGPLHNTTAEGPDVMALTPDPETPMFGRSEFLIHGDSLEHPGAASHGCIILSQRARLLIGSSYDKRLLVEA